MTFQIENSNNSNFDYLPTYDEFKIGSKSTFLKPTGGNTIQNLLFYLQLNGPHRMRAPVVVRTC